MLFNQQTSRMRPATPEDRRMIKTEYKDFAPRFGFAWSPGGSQNFVVRSSYGIFFDRMQGDDNTWDTEGDPRNLIQQHVDK